MTAEPTTFRTKTGVCRVSPDKLVLERTGVRGQAAQTLHGDSKTRTWLVYLVIVAVMAHTAWSALRAGDTALASVWAALAGWIVVSLARTRDFSMVNELSRTRMERVEFVRGIAGLTRDRVVVHFRDDAGKQARRFIIMPGALQQGRGELERARAALQNQGWC